MDVVTMSHGDVIIRHFKRLYPSSYDRDDPSSMAPKTGVLEHMARSRETPESDDGSTADEGAPPRGSGWVGHGSPMMAGSGYSCDGQTLASPGRWPVESRRYAVWKKVSEMAMEFSRMFGSVEVLMTLAMGRVTESPVPKEAIDSLRNRFILHLEDTCGRSN